MSTSNVSSTAETLMNFASRTSTTKSSDITDAQDRFLTLLTTQLRNQDPLNPMDNAEVTSQLAQISTVSGIEKLNATLQSLVADSVDMQTAQAASLVGHAVLVSGTALRLSEGSSVGGIELASGADKVEVTIKDANGVAVKTLSLGDLDAGVHNFTWDGIATDGTEVEDGTYTISVKATVDGEEVKATPLTLGAVRSVIRGSDGFTMDLGNLGIFKLAELKQIL